MRFKSTGCLRYSKNPLKLILSVDQGIVDYYYSLIPRWTWPRVNRQKFKAHISVVRNVIPDQKHMKLWGKYEGRIIEFEYDPFVMNDGTYYWLNAFSPALEQVRIELGLPIADKFTRAPDGSHRFHITVANNKSHPCSSAESERRSTKPKVVGSNPTMGAKRRNVQARSTKHLHKMQ